MFSGAFDSEFLSMFVGKIGLSLGEGLLSGFKGLAGPFFDEGLGQIRPNMNPLCLTLTEEARAAENMFSGLGVVISGDDFSGFEPEAFGVSGASSFFDSGSIVVSPART